MEIKQRGNAFGYKLLLTTYSIFGYRVVAFILNFVALYYFFFAPSVKKNIQNYYNQQDLDFNNLIYYKHIKKFALAIFDRFVSRIKPDDLLFHTHNEKLIEELDEGGVVLLSHVGSWASAAHCLKDQLPPMNIVMRENTQENIQKVEQDNKRDNETNVKIIDINNGTIATNIQIANALISQELVALMVDRAVDARQTIEVDFFKSKVKINRTPFEIAIRMKKPLLSIFVMNTNVKEYNLYLNMIKTSSIDVMAQEYMGLLENMLREYPSQWYNFYDFFESNKESK